MALKASGQDGPPPCRTSTHGRIPGRGLQGFRSPRRERERERDVYICMYTHIQGAALIFLGFFCLVG